MGSHGLLLHHHRREVELLEDQKVHGKCYISNIFPLQEIRKAFLFHESRKGLKVVVKPGEYNE